MATPVEPLPLDRPVIDPFVYRLLAAISLGIAVLNAGFAINLRFQRIPNLQRVIENVRLDSIGRGGEWLLEKHYLLSAAVILALGVSVAAVWKRQRSQLVAAYLLNFIAIGVSIAAEVAVTRVWTRVLGKLMQ